MADEKKSTAQRLYFKRKFDFTMPSRAMVHYPEGFVGRVKAEVAEAALAAGAAREAKPGEKSDIDETLEDGLPVSLATPQALTPNLSLSTDDEKDTTS